LRIRKGASYRAADPGNNRGGGGTEEGRKRKGGWNTGPLQASPYVRTVEEKLKRKSARAGGDMGQGGNEGGEKIGGDRIYGRRGCLDH